MLKKFLTMGLLCGLFTNSCMSMSLEDMNKLANDMVRELEAEEKEQELKNKAEITKFVQNTTEKLIREDELQRAEKGRKEQEERLKRLEENRIKKEANKEALGSLARALQTIICETPEQQEPTYENVISSREKKSSNLDLSSSLAKKGCAPSGKKPPTKKELKFEE